MRVSGLSGFMVFSTLFWLPVVVGSPCGVLPSYKGAVLFWGPKKGPVFRESCDWGDM